MTGSPGTLFFVLLAHLTLTGMLRANAGAKVPGPDGRQVKSEIFKMVFSDRSLLRARIYKALRKHMHAPETAEIEMVPAKHGRLLAGEFSKIAIRLQDVKIDGLRVSRARISFRNCCIDLEKLVLKNRLKFKPAPGARAEMLLVVKEKDINELLANQKGSIRIRNPSIDFHNGYMKLAGAVRLFLFRNRFRVAGTLSVRDDDQIYFHPKRMNVDFLPIPGFVLRAIERQVNPLVRFDTIGCTVKLAAVKLTEGSLYISTRGFASDLDALVKAESADTAVAHAFTPAKPAD